MRGLMWFSLGFAGACGVGAYLFRETGLLILAAVCFLLMVPLVILGRKEKRLLCAAAVMLGMAAGSGWFHGFDTGHIAPARAVDDLIMEIRLTADSYSWETDYGSAVDGSVELEDRSYQVRLYLNEVSEIEPGDVIVTEAKLRLTDEGGVNEPTFHRSNGILLLAYQRGEAAITKGIAGFSEFPGILRQRLKSLIDSCVPSDVSGFAKALLLGDKMGVDYARSVDFKVTGVSHVIAVSGLHVSILFSVVYLLAGKRRILTALIGIPTVLLFAAMVGFTPSVTRAAIMQILMMLALAVNREYDPPTALAFAVVSMLMWNPLEITSAGFQLSVASVAGIYLFNAPVRSWIAERIPKGKLWDGFASAVSVTLSATLMTTPLVAHYYHTISLIGVAANLLIVPVISVIFYGAMLVCLAGWFSAAAGSIAGWLVAWPIRYTYAVAGILADVPLAAVYTRSIYVLIWLIFAYVLIVWVIVSKRRRPLIVTCIGAIGLCMALMASYAEPLLYDYRVTVLPVGQGQCILLQSRGRTFMVDCGGDYDQDAGECAAETLLSHGIRRIDGLILTHYDRDHVGGVEYLAQRIDVGAVFLPQASDSDGRMETMLASIPEAERIWVTEDMTISTDTINLTIFAPEGGTFGNESCAAVLFQSEKCDTLITGDLSAFRERQLLRRVEIPDLEVLIVGHHGSQNSTSAELLAATRPDVAIISVGEDNSYGHPAQETLDRLEEAGCEIYRTDLHGEIIYKG